MISFNDKLFFCEQETANMFVSYFSSVYSATTLGINAISLNSLPFDLPNNVYFTCDDVFKGLSRLHDNWSIGLDGLSGEFLFQLRSVIAYPLWILFKRYLDEGVFPSFLKLSSITSISFYYYYPSLVIHYLFLTRNQFLSSHVQAV